MSRATTGKRNVHAELLILNLLFRFESPPLWLCAANDPRMRHRSIDNLWAVWATQAKWRALNCTTQRETTIYRPWKWVPPKPF
jgi:hypothetical protein